MTEYSTWEKPLAPIDPTALTVAQWWFRLDVDDEAFQQPPLGLLIGEQPGPSSNGRLPLWPHPPKSAGGRLHAMSGMPVRDYLLRLARVNMERKAVVEWDPGSMRARAYQLLMSLPPDARVVLCGARARDAFTMPRGWFHTVTMDVSNIKVVAIPHPSGRCLEYNDPSVVESARQAIQWAAGWTS
jgi:hypothetical protein